jgi:DNA (cytosine-5)-methyltransferase 1
MSRGLVDAGFDVVRAYDAWPVAVETYRRNIGPHVVEADLNNLLSIVPQISALAPDIVCGGPPCQDYSLAGQRQEGENASMTVAFAIVVTAARPEWFIMENVVQAQKSQAWAEARAILKRAGYGLSESKINAAYYGVPQSRRRLFVIGRLGERDGFLQSAIAAKASAKPMTLREFFDPTMPEATYFPATSDARRSFYSSEESAPTIREKSMRPLPPTHRPHPADAALLTNGYVYSRPLRDGRGVRSIDEPMTTITRTSWERPTSRYLNSPHPADPVPAATTAVLVIDQISRIQGFPTDWKWIATSKQDIRQMIANAVPAPVAKSLGEVILERHRGQSVPAIEGRFVDWLVRSGRKRATAHNIKANVGRARRLLDGRTFADVGCELLALEVAPGFDALPKNTRSDLRRALAILAEFEASKLLKQKKPRRPTELPSLELAPVEMLKEAA